MSLKEIIKNNQELLQGSPNTYFSPGRVNLIGEHVDYLGGNVFPTGIDLGTYAFVTKRQDKEIHFLSENFKEKGVIIADLDNLVYKESDNWTNYCKGMFKAFQQKGVTFEHGYNILVYGTLPNGAGLSSSASLEVLIGTMIKYELNLDVDMVEIVKTAQDVENNFVGVNCGIMDQFAVGMSKENTAIYLNTNTLEYELVPLDLKDYTLVIANSNKKRALADSKYNERRSETDKGLDILQKNGVEVKELCDLSARDLEEVKHFISDPIISKRVHHAVHENQRTKDAVVALTKGDLLTFGTLMNQSHDSLRDDYEVSCKELDTLVDSFRTYGAIGARMTGAGFGGCAIALVKTDSLTDVLANVKSNYQRIIGYNADFYPVKTHDGANKLIIK